MGYVTKLLTFDLGSMISPDGLQAASGMTFMCQAQMDELFVRRNSRTCSDAFWTLNTQLPRSGQCQVVKLNSVERFKAAIVVDLTTQKTLERYIGGERG